VVWRLPYKSDGIGFSLDREIHLFTVDKKTGDLRQLTDGPFDVRSASFSPDGRRIAYARTRTGREAHRTDVWIMNADGSDAHQVSKDVASVQYPTWSPDGRWIAFSGSEEEGDSSSRLWLIDTQDWSVRALGDEGLEVESGDSVHWGEDSRSLIFILVRRGLQEVAQIRVPDGELKTLIGGERHVLKLAVARGALYYACASIGEPAELWLADRDGSHERKLSDLNSWWRERLAPKISLRRFDVPDGNGGTEQIEAWLILPAEGDGPFPLLLDVHGGPHSVAFLEFRKAAWRHVLASRGWAVLVPHAAGSSSFGVEFRRRVIGRWGELDLPQHLAAIKALQDEGIADERVAIYGKSYGGYLSAWAITQTEMFKAAVVSAPVANIESHFGTSDSGFYVTPFAMFGEPFVNRDLARKLSPLVHMHKARTPTLLLQGKDDQRCPVGQSEEIFATLMRSSDVAVEMVLYPGSDHHLAEEGSPAFRIDYVERLAAWVEEWANQRKGSSMTAPDQSTGSSSGGQGNP
jgi:dipeptidyl aminopeptidase/acylaminoacyl peptidase